MMAELITLAEYKAYKKITKTDSDTELDIIIKSVSAIVKEYCGHTFIDHYSVPKEEIFSIGPGQNAVMLDEWPINEIVAVEIRDSFDSAYTAVSNSDYYVDKYCDSIFLHSGSYPIGYGAVKVTYKAGYATTPPDVKIACMDLVSHYLREEYKERRAVGSTTIDNSTRFNSTKFSTSKWPSHVVRIMDMYRNV